MLLYFPKETPSVVVPIRTYLFHRKILPTLNPGSVSNRRFGTNYLLSEQFHRFSVVLRMFNCH